MYECPRRADIKAIKKSEFSVTCTKFLGFIVSTNGIEVNPEKVAVIKNWKELLTIKSI